MKISVCWINKNRRIVKQYVTNIDILIVASITDWGIGEIVGYGPTATVKAKLDGAPPL